MAEEIEFIDDYDFMRELARRLTSFIQRHPTEAHNLLINNEMILKYEVAASFKPFTNMDEIPVSLSAIFSMMTQMPKGVSLGVRMVDGKLRSFEAAYPDEATKVAVEKILLAAEQVADSKPDPD